MNGRLPASRLGTRQNAAASTWGPASAAPLAALPDVLPPEPPPEVPAPPLLVPLAPAGVPELAPLPDVALSVPDPVPPPGGPTGLLAQPAKRPSRIDEAGVRSRRAKRVMVTSVQGWVESQLGAGAVTCPKSRRRSLSTKEGRKATIEPKKSLILT